MSRIIPRHCVVVFGRILMLALMLSAAVAAAPRSTALGSESQRSGSGSADVQDVASLALLASSDLAVDLRARLPRASIEDVKAEGALYTRLFGAGYGTTGAFGLPDLPVLRRDVEIPFGAAVSLEILDAQYADYTLAELGFHTLYPLQRPVPKLPGAREGRPFEINREFYAEGTLYPASPLSLGDAYVVRGHRIQPVEIWPAAYDPSAGTVRFYAEITFRLALDGSNMARTRDLAERYASPAFERFLSGRVVNYNQGRPTLESGVEEEVGYLILVADTYYDAMIPFVQLRESRGFDVTMTRVSEIPGGGSNSDIRAYIADAYVSWPIPPSYVLLVGDTDTIPGWNSLSADEVTDLYYATMDAGDDWHPDIGRGRFPVRSVAQTTAIVDKYLEYANFTGVEPWLKKAAFIATCDNWQTAEGTHNYVIQNYTEPNGYTGIFPGDPEPGGDKIYCVTYSGSTINITNAANDGRWAIVYSGHGYTGGWGDGDVSYSSADVNNLEDYGFFPFVGSHACNTGDFDITEAYCETWVLQEGKGALVFWGSSDNSYWNEDDWLERGMFDELFAEVKGHADVTEMTYSGLSYTESMSPSLARYYWETYNVMGDPAVRVFIEPEAPTFTLGIDPTEQEVCSEGSVQSTVQVGSILGYDSTVYLSTEPPPDGISASFDPSSSPAPFASDMTLTVAPGTPAASYEIVVLASDNIDVTQDASVLLNVVQGPPATPALMVPADGALDQSSTPAFEWGDAPGATTFNLQIDTNPRFTAPVIDLGSIAGTHYMPDSPLMGGTCYWWHAQGENACGSGQWAEPFRFATAALEEDFYDNMESGDAQWTHGATQGSDHWALTTDQSHSPTHAWYVPDDPVITDSRLRTSSPVFLGSGSTLTFWHRHQFEKSYDGGVLEISIDGGATWTDLGPYISTNGYNGIISTCCGNPLGSRQAWISDLDTWTQVEVDLSSYAGQSGLIRWRLGCDSSLGDVGWYIDDVQVTSPLPPNPAPTVTGITPDEGPSDTPTPVQIAGTGFIETPSVRLGSTWLEDAAFISETSLTAAVPAGIPPGVYDLTLYNGDCQIATLPSAFTIGDAENTLHVDGIRMRYVELDGRYLVYSTLRILDQDNQIVTGATVRLQWTLPDGSTVKQEAQTDYRGLARFRLRSLVGGKFRSCVADVIKLGFTYAPEQNRTTCKVLLIP